MSGWPSGLRRCVQVAVSPGGVGSNPTSDILLTPACHTALQEPVNERLKENCTNFTGGPQTGKDKDKPNDHTCSQERKYKIAVHSTNISTSISIIYGKKELANVYKSSSIVPLANPSGEMVYMHPGLTKPG